MRRAAFLTALVLTTARAAHGYSPCEDATLGAVELANPLRSESAPTTLVCNAELASVADDSAVVTWVTNKTAPSNVECWGLDAAQWIKNTDADGDGIDDNVFGRLRRHVVNITGRATYNPNPQSAFSPTACFLVAV